MNLKNILTYINFYIASPLTDNILLVDIGLKTDSYGNPIPFVFDKTNFLICKIYLIF